MSQIDLPGIEAPGYYQRNSFIDDSGRYRWHLSRSWNRKVKPSALFIMLNPSTADGIEDDPTIRRCVQFAKRFGCNSLEVVNLFAWRATDPKELKLAADPVGLNNDTWIQTCLNHSNIEIAAWGEIDRWAWQREDQVLVFLRSTKRRIYCLGKTASGRPRHPLYVPSAAELDIYVDYDP